MNDAIRKIQNFRNILQKKELNINVGITDIVYAVICYVMSACEILDGRTPFAVSAFAAAFTRGKGGVFLLLSILGLFRFRMDFDVVFYIVSMLISTAFMSMIRSKTGFKAFCTGVSLFIVLFCKNIISGFMWDTFIIDSLESVIAFGGVVAFSSSVMLLSCAGERNYILDKEILYLLVFFALMVRCTVSMPLLFGMNISVVMAVLFLLIFNLEGGLSVGATMGIVFGIVTCVSGSDMAASIGAFSLASLCAGILKQFGKCGVLLGFVMANTAMVAFFSGEILPFDIFEIVFAGIILMIIPHRMISFFSSLSAKTVHAFSGGYIEEDKIQRVIAGRLDKLSDSYCELASAYNKCFENKNMSKEYIIHMLDMASAKICPECGLKYNCWERGYKESYKAMLEMLETAENEGELTPNDVPQKFRQKCIKIDEFVQAFNRMYEVYKVEKLWQLRLNESRMLVSAQLNGVSRSVKKLLSDFDMCLDVAAEKEVITRLDIEGIDFVDVTFLKSRDDSFAVEITMSDSRLSLKDESKIASVLKEVTGHVVSKTSVHYVSEGTVFTFKPSSKFAVSVGNAGVIRHGEKVSGDSYLICENSYGEFVAAISDGMGTGAKASGESMNAMELLKNFMSAGVDVETALELINSAFLLRSSGDSFVTMDVCVVNKFDGHVRFYKNGAAPGYIKNEHGISGIYSDSLPFGVLSDYGQIKTEIYPLDKFSLIVLMSDGISDIFHSEGDTKIKELIDKANSFNPQIVASFLMNEALKICDKRADDDMTVLVISVKKI